MPRADLPIIDQLTHPSLGRLDRNLILLTFSGAGSLIPPQDVLGNLTYGIGWTFIHVPIGFGTVVGNPTTYLERMIQLHVEYELHSGQLVGVQYQDVIVDGGMYFWDEPLPSAVLYAIAPGVTTQFFWLQTRPI